jgi:cell division control protein 7
VYKAIDVNHYQTDNSDWLQYSRQDLLDASKIFAHIAQMENAARTRAHKRACSHPINLALRRFIVKKYFDQEEEMVDRIDLEMLRLRMERFPPQCVAIKRINSTSGPKRIADEITFLTAVGGEHNVIPIISGIRHEDQILLVFPFFKSDDFRDFMLTASIDDIANYIRLLLEAVAHMHSKVLIHRDIKPSNFLFSREESGSAVLVDFGLAQFGDPAYSSDKLIPVRTLPQKKIESIARLRQTLINYPPGYIVNDPRGQMKASRAGTRGFRAPEVLFKISHQSVAIDVWSVGVIMLTLLTHRYPFFQSTDDQDAIVEIATIFGRKEMEAAAKVYYRTWKSNIPSIPENHIGFPTLVNSLNPEFAPQVTDEAYDLLERLLRLNVNDRITARNALHHPFLRIN